MQEEETNFKKRLSIITTTTNTTLESIPTGSESASVSGGNSPTVSQEIPIKVGAHILLIHNFLHSFLRLNKPNHTFRTFQHSISTETFGVESYFQKRALYLINSTTPHICSIFNFINLRFNTVTHRRDLIHDFDSLWIPKTIALVTFPPSWSPIRHCRYE